MRIGPSRVVPPVTKTYGCLRVYEWASQNGMDDESEDESAVLCPTAAAFGQACARGLSFGTDGGRVDTGAFRSGHLGWTALYWNAAFIRTTSSSSPQMSPAGS